MNTIIFAVIFPFIAAVICWFLFKNRHSDSDRSVIAVIMAVINVIELAAVVNLLLCDLAGAELGGISFAQGVGGLGLSFQYSGFRGIFGVLTAFAWFVTALYSKQFMKNDKRVIRYDFFNLLTLGATMGIFYAADFFTLFFFFEIMSFTSFVWVAHRQTCAAQYASGTYLGIAVAGGMAILMGLFLLYSRLGTLRFGELHDSAMNYIFTGGSLTWLLIAAGCMFVGFGAKAGAFPVHVWLPASYTESPVPATALLSAILSKTGVLGVLLVTLEILPMQGSWGMFVLIVGVITMVLGGIKGVMSNNLKTTLAYSSMSQIGFILVGVGMLGLLSGLLAGCSDVNEVIEIIDAYYMAVNGTILHMLNHSLVKLVLFMIVGIVFMHTGGYELNRVRGFGRNKPFLWVTFLLAAAGVGGIPLLNGYVSKTLLHESIIEYMALSGTESAFRIIEYLFLFSGGLTVAYMTKLFVVLFVEENEDIGQQDSYDTQKKYASLWSKLAISLCALLILLIGILPNIIADRIAAHSQDLVHLTLSEQEVRAEAVNYFSFKSLSGAIISIVVGAIVYILIVRLLMLRKKDKGYCEIFPAWLDMEKYVYRAVFYRFIPFLLGIISRILDSLVDTVVVIFRKTVYRDRPLPYELPEGNHLTHLIGRSMENVQKIYCMIRKRKYVPRHYEHKLALKNIDIFENVHIIERSLSFGLFMFCVGLGLTMIYLLVVN